MNVIVEIFEDLASYSEYQCVAIAISYASLAIVFVAWSNRWIAKSMLFLSIIIPLSLSVYVYIFFFLHGRAPSIIIISYIAHFFWLPPTNTVLLIFMIRIWKLNPTTKLASIIFSI